MEKLYKVIVTDKNFEEHEYWVKATSHKEAKDFTPTVCPKKPDSDEYDFDANQVPLDVLSVSSEELLVKATFYCGTNDNYLWLKEQALLAKLKSEKAVGKFHIEILGYGDWINHLSWCWKFPIVSCNWTMVADQVWMDRYREQLFRYQQTYRNDKDIKTISEAVGYTERLKPPGKKYGIAAFKVGQTVVDDSYGKGVIKEIIPTEKKLWSRSDENYIRGMLLIELEDGEVIQSTPSCCVLIDQGECK